MKITILAIGSRGDIQPFVALGKGLQAAEHEVNVATHAIFETFVRSAGLDFSLIQANPQEMLDTKTGRALMESWGSPIRALQQLIRTMKPELFRGFDDCWNACQGTDLILYSTLGLTPGMCISEQLNIPAIAAFPQPLHPTSEFPSLIITLHNLGRFLNRLTYSISLPVPWLLTRSIINEWRQQRLNLPLLGLNYFPGQWKKMRSPVMYAFSPNVVPRPADWGDHIAVTGYWFLDESTSWQPPTELVDFLESGPPPVYIGFGSMIVRSPEETADLVLQALDRTRQRGLLLTGWGGLQQSDLPDHVFKIESAPHDWLFPRMAAVVHHGGAGTTAAGLRAGIPSIIIPFLLDQPFWANRVADLGVGPPPILRKRLSVDRLAAAINTAVTDTIMRQRAAALGEHIRAEDGIARAIEFINRCL